MLEGRESLHVVARGDAARCALCHDALAGQGAACDGCGAAMHEDCAAALAACPTLGCARARVQLRGAVSGAKLDEPAPRPRAWVVMVHFALACAALIAYLGVALLFGVLVGGALGSGLVGAGAAVALALVTAPALERVWNRLQRAASVEE